MVSAIKGNRARYGYADYLKTNETAEKRAAYYYNVALEKSGSVAVAEKVRDAFLAKRGYMEPVIDILAQRFMQA